MLPAETTTTKQRNPTFRPFASSNVPTFLSSQFKDALKSNSSASNNTLQSTKPVTSFSIPKESLEDFDIFSETIPTTSNSFSSNAINTPLTNNDTYSVEKSTTTPGGRVVTLLSPSKNFLGESSGNPNLQPQKKVEFSSTVPISPSQLDPYFQNEVTASRIPTERNWVTVFGFPPSRLSFVLKQFTSYGEILDRKTVNGSNWVHLLYRDSFAAKKALSKSGKIYNGDLMLGVVECVDSSVINNGSSENTKKRKFTETNTSAQTKYPNQWIESENGVKKRALNPVGAPTVPTNIFANDTANRPQPQRGFWSKLVDMVFKF